MRFVFIFLLALTANAQKQYQEVSYLSGKLHIQAYLYLPAGNGPFPMVVYNHGSRPGADRISMPFLYVGKMLTAAGYAVLVPERRGYGKSDGPTFTDEIGQDRGTKFVVRVRQEADDVLAVLDYLKTVTSVDGRRVAIVGWSLGGIVSVFAASRSTGFRAVVDQAGASLTWDRSPAIRKALPDAAALVKAPLLGMVAENERTTKAVEAVVEAAHAKLIVYPAFTPPAPVPGIAPGHMIFGEAGAPIWEGDLIRFLKDRL